MTSWQVGKVRASVVLAVLLMTAGGMPARSQGVARGSAGGSSTLDAGDAGIAAAEDLRLQEMDRLIWEGHYQAADDLARAALTDLSIAGEGDSTAAAQVLDRLLELMLLREEERLPETLPTAQRAVSIKEVTLGPRHPETAHSLILLGQLYLQRQDFDQALAQLSRAFGVLKSTLGPGHPQTSTAMYLMGGLYARLDQCEEARPWLEQVLAAREGAPGTGDASAAKALSLIGDCIARDGSFSVALPMLRQAVEIAERAVPAGNAALATCRLRLAQRLLMDGQYAEARPHLETVLQSYEEAFGRDSAPVTWPLTLLAGLYMETGEYVRSESLYERTIALDIQHYGPEDDRLAGDLMAAASLQVYLHNYSKALDLLESSAKITEKVYGPVNPSLADVVGMQAVALGESGRYAEAEAALTRAFDIFKSNFGPESPDAAWYLNVLAGIRLKRGDLPGARAAAEEAFAILSKTPDSNLPVFETILATLEEVHRAQGNGAEAMALSNRRLAVATNLYGSSHPNVASALIDRASLLAELGRSDEAVQHAATGEEISRQYLLLLARSAAEPEASRYATHRESGRDLLVTMATQTASSTARVAEAAADGVVRARALVLDELAERRRSAFAALDPETARLLRELQRASDRLSNLIVRGPREGDSPTYPEALAIAHQDKGRAERALAAWSADFRKALAQSAVGLEEIREALPVEAALVGFVRYESQDTAPRQADAAPQPRAASPSYAAFVLTSRGGPPSFVQLGDASTIELAVRQWRNDVVSEALASGRRSRANEARYRDVAARLRRMIWDPVAEQLADAQRVFVVPDGAISLIDFAALPVGEQEYLVERGSGIHYFSSERDLLMHADGVAGHGGLLALSNPKFDDRALFAALRPAGAAAAVAGAGPDIHVYRGPRSACGTFQTMRFADLPASAQEARAVTALWKHNAATTTRGGHAPDDAGGVLALSGAAASEAAFKRSASGRQVLHLATHGFFLGGHCASTLDPSSPGVDAATSVSAITRENPLLLSGLVLAGANHRDVAGPDEDDGILTAEEIAALDLRGTEWAVLSACDTGIGEIRSSEGVFGLRRAFQLAGARTVIMSLWPVEDESTRRWMTELYRRRFVADESTAEAVNGASLAMLQQQRRRGGSTHPFYWAGFIAAGDWR